MRILESLRTHKLNNVRRSVDLWGHDNVEFHRVTEAADDVFFRFLLARQLPFKRAPFAVDAPISAICVQDVLGSTWVHVGVVCCGSGGPFFFLD